MELLAVFVVGLLGLAIRPQSEIVLSADGPDADAALAALREELGDAVQSISNGTEAQS